MERIFYHYLLFFSFFLYSFFSFSLSLIILFSMHKNIFYFSRELTE